MHKIFQYFRMSAFWLVPVLALVWWRAHTFAPDIVQGTGLPAIWPVVEGRSEPLDCDESAYAYMGRRQAEGAVLYRNLTEYKPPGGYWFYAIGVAIGGAHELTVRLMILPVLVANLLLIGWILKKTTNTIAALAGMFSFILLSTDPYVFGNGSNFEHLMNLGLTASIAALIYAGSSTRPARWILISGIAIGLATTVKQVCLLGLVPVAVQLYRDDSRFKSWVRNCIVLSAGFCIPILACILVLVAQGAAVAAMTDVVEYSRSLASLTPPDANAPPGLYRWLTGNSDPRNGRLPWPFGRTDWLVWWGTGSWPIQIVSLIASIIFISKWKKNASRPGIFFAMYWLSCWLMVVLPGLYWQHYYMLLAPACSLLAGSALGRCVDVARISIGFSAKFKSAVAMSGIFIAICLTTGIQIKDYLQVPAEKLTVQYKGGAQWVSLRLLSEDFNKRIVDWSPRPHLEVWGWQSPLLFYTGLDAPNRYFFTDPLMKAYAKTGLPVIQPRLEELTRVLNEQPPELIFCGDPPYPQLKQLIDRDYIVSSIVGSSPEGQGLYVRRDKYAAFHSPR